MHKNHILEIDLPENMCDESKILEYLCCAHVETCGGNNDIALTLCFACRFENILRAWTLKQSHAHVLFNVGVFVICMLPLPCSPNCAVFFILQSFCEIIVIDVAFSPTSIFDNSKLSLSLCNLNVL